MKLEVKHWLKGWLLLLFMKVFDKELDLAEPEVEKFFAEVLRDYL